MSLRDKAREVKAAGEAERGNFTPHGKPKELYQWWLDESPSRKARKIRAGTMRENFCHYWRVVLFWVPLRKAVYAVDKHEKVFGSILLLPAIVGMLFVLFTNPLAILTIIAMATGLVLSGGGIFAGVSAALSERQRNSADLMTNKKAIVCFFILGFWTAIPVFLITSVIRLYVEHLSEYDKTIGLSLLVMGVLVATSVILGTSGLGGLLHVLLVLACAIVLIAFAVLVLVTVATYIDGKRSIAKARRRDRIAVYVAENGHAPVRQPSKVGKFFSAVGDFIVLLAQVVRVKKWKICPIVEIDDNERIAA